MHAVNKESLCTSLLYYQLTDICHHFATHESLPRKSAALVNRNFFVRFFLLSAQCEFKRWTKTQAGWKDCSICLRHWHAHGNNTTKLCVVNGSIDNNSQRPHTSAFPLPSYVCGKNFHEDPFSSFYVKLLTDRQTPDRALHNHLGGG